MVTRLLSAPRIDFAPIRRELDLPRQFTAGAQREADDAARRVKAVLAQRVDRTSIALVTIDPPSSRDLDQAVRVERRPRGYRVYYAIADVRAFVPIGGDLESETWQRGQTIYLPDGNVPLHPTALSEGAASLLPNEIRPAVLWTIDLDADAHVTAVAVERAAVRSRAKLAYAGVQADADAGTLAEPIDALPELGRRLIARALDRGAIELPVPEQEVESNGDGTWRLTLRSTLPAEQWNAHISLLTGMCAARMMLDGGLGLLRTMPSPDAKAVAELRVTAAALDIVWPDGASVGRVLSEVDPSDPRGAAFADRSAELMRGADYTAFATTPPIDPVHGAVAAPYAHVTAPLRRLADRYATEVCLALTAGDNVPDDVAQALPRLPEVMQTSGRRASAAERGAIDLAECVLLANRVGEIFEAAVVDVDEPRPGRPPSGVIALTELAVQARCQGQLAAGARVRARLDAVDVARRVLTFIAV